MLNLENERIPNLLRACAKWIPWRAGRMDENGKFPKYPIDASTGRKINALDPRNWLNIDAVTNAVAEGRATGIGFVLDGMPITQGANGEPLYLIGIDIDAKSNIGKPEIDHLKQTLNRTYVEISPSGKGLRLFVLSRVPVKAGNRNGYEMYTSKRFLTITGRNSHGNLCEATNGVLTLHQKWFPEKSPVDLGVVRKCCGTKLEETPANVAWVRDMLRTVTADCSYETYRNVIWALEDLQWDCGEEIQRSWSLTAPHRFSENCLQSLRNSFGLRPGVQFGTLVYYARLAGYRRPRCTP